MGYQENHLPNEQHNLSPKVKIFTSDFIPDWASSEYETITPGTYDMDGVQLIRLETVVKFKSIGNPILSGLEQSLAEYNPDIIHAHGILSLSTFQAYRYAKKAGIPLFIDSHVDNGNFNLNSIPKKVGFNAYRILCIPMVVEYANKILPVNPKAEDFLIKNLDIPKHKIEFLPLGVPIKIFSPERGNGSIREDLGIKEEELLLISSGNLNKRKDLDVLIESFAEYLADYDDATLLLLGNWEEDYRTQIENTILDYSIRDSVVLHGRVDNKKLPLFYNAADFGVWPGKLGITIIEAIGCGLPVIVSDSMATEFLIDNGNGLSFQRGNVADLRSCIEMYGQDSQLRSEHSDLARKYAVTELEWSQIAKKSINIYQEA